MRIRLLLVAIACLSLFLGGIAWWVSQLYQQGTPRQALWQAQFVNMQGNVQKIPQPDKRPLVVNFWASWCGPCREEMPDLADLAISLQGRVDFVGVAVDNTAAVQQFLATIQVPYPILLGQADTIALMKAEGNAIGGLPFTLVYTANGRPIMTKAGKIQKAALEKLLRDVIDSSPPLIINERTHKRRPVSY